ncbi:hypothetical protein, partial [Acetobacterium bakii]
MKNYSIMIALNMKHINNDRIRTVLAAGIIFYLSVRIGADRFPLSASAANTNKNDDGSNPRRMIIQNSIV